MDFPDPGCITSSNWAHSLPQIIQDITECSFVALDFEFSGIPCHQSVAARQQSLQERYVELKEAASIYQILQVGITIVKEDAVGGEYTAKPYNIHLSPLVDPSFRIDRTFSFSSGAVQFLLKTGFDLNAPFLQGVQYLSEKEEREILDEAERYSNSRSQRNTISSLNLPESDTESAGFLAAVRKDIQQWLDVGSKKQDYLNIPSRNANSKDSWGKGSLNRFQKRLVHQLVETEFPSLTSIGSSDFVRIARFDQKREDRIQREKLGRIKKQLLQHRGFRWVIDALTGADLTELGSDFFKTLHASNEESDPMVSRQQIMDRLRRRNGCIPIVGHNLFMDVIYMWQCFYGDLPDRLEDFAQMLHAKFPMLIDTKYVFTHDCGDINPVASLDDIAKAHLKIMKPEMTIDATLTRYQNTTFPHEAGYDSLLTAQNFIKQAVQLPGTRSASTLASKDTIEEHHEVTSVQATDEGTKIISETMATKQVKNHGLSTRKARSEVAGKNTFDVLREDDSQGGDVAIGSGAVTAVIDSPELIPSFSSPLWKTYANKLRVFGTQERVFTIGSA